MATPLKEHRKLFRTTRNNASSSQETQFGSDNPHQVGADVQQRYKQLVIKTKYSQKYGLQYCQLEDDELVAVIEELQSLFRQGLKSNEADIFYKELKEETGYQESKGVGNQEKETTTEGGFDWNELPEVYKGWKKIGIHQTSSENVQTLVTSGPLVSKIGTGRGSGKGPGFYITPVKPGKKDAKKEASAVNYGDGIVAVYVPEFLNQVTGISDSTIASDRNHGADLNYYTMGAGGELVVTAKCFDLVKLVANKSDLAKLEEIKLTDQIRDQIFQGLYDYESSFYAKEIKDYDFKKLHEYREHVQHVQRLNRLSDIYERLNEQYKKIKKRYDSAESVLKKDALMESVAQKKSALDKVVEEWLSIVEILRAKNLLQGNPSIEDLIDQPDHPDDEDDIFK